MNAFRKRHLQRLAIIAGLAIALGVTGAAFAQSHSLLQKLGLQKEHSQADKLPASEVASGLKEALAKGTTQAINSLGRDNGFWKNDAVRILLPKSLKKAAKVARQLGQGDKVDAFELSMNRAAEKAVPQVADIFGGAIRKMSLSDARAILAGGDHAATDYFRRVAGDTLTQRIHPIVSQATSRVGVTEKYKSMTGSSSGLGSALSMLDGDKKEKPLDLDDYVTEKTLDGLFKEIGDEEKSIRSNPLARSTDLLQKVFGGS